MTQKFKLSEKQVKEVYGDKFEEKMTSWQEGQDYVIRKCFKSFKRVYREDLLDSLEAKLGLDEVKVDVVPIKLEKMDDLPKKDEDIYEDVVENIFPNTRYVRTRSGKTIFVGGKGTLLKRGQRITCKGYSLFLGKAQSYP
jgi:hypothetical protein